MDVQQSTSNDSCLRALDCRLCLFEVRQLSVRVLLRWRSDLLWWERFVFERPLLGRSSVVRHGIVLEARTGIVLYFPLICTLTSMRPSNLISLTRIRGVFGVSCLLPS